MKKIVALSLSIVLLALCLSGCVTVTLNPYSVVGKGDSEKYDIEVGGFTGIQISSVCNIHLYTADKAAVTLEVQPNLREYFSVEVKNGILVVKSTRTINISNSHTPIVTVYAPALNSLTVDGACDFTAHDTITADSFALDIAGAASGRADFEVSSLSVSLGGAGSFTLTGTADTAEIHMAGVGDLDARALRTRAAGVNMDGAGTVRVNCSEQLTIDASGVGTVEYSGSPNVNTKRDGLVSVKKVD